jgi:pyruvate dehydrogenase E2 component (dihydrolipoamide acetyltransferase)
MTVFKLPDLGEGLSEAEVLRWHVQVGDPIEVDAPMLAVETAKAVVEVPSPVSGTVTALHAQPGDRIEIGAPLVEFSVEGADAESAVPAERAAQPDRSAQQAADSGTVVGHMPSVGEDYADGAALAAPGAVTTPRSRAVPAARTLARSLGVALQGLSGSGPGGVITIEDVLARAGPAAGSAVPAPVLQPPLQSGAEVQALRGLRRAMAQSMTASRDQVAACTVCDDADLQAWGSSAGYSVRVLRAIAVAAQSERALNAWYDAAHERRLLFPHVDVGLAVDTPDGLIVPVIRRVESLDAAQMRAELERLKRGARERTLGSEELRHCTFMLSNFGTMAGRYATPVVVPPTVAILAIGRVGRGQSRCMPLSLSFDHRVVTGGEAVRFLSALIADLELAQ